MSSEPKPITEFLRETPTEIIFRFRCECTDCDADGELALDKKDGMKPFNCPEGCGAVYVPWKYDGAWELKCVVLPNYATGELEGRKG